MIASENVNVNDISKINAKIQKINEQNRNKKNDTIHR